MKTGECSECGKVFSLRKSGRLRAHGYGRSPWYETGPGCPGSGQFPSPPKVDPKEAENAEEEE